MQVKSLSKKEFERLEVEVVDERHRRNSLNTGAIRIFRAEAKMFVYFAYAEKEKPDKSGLKLYAMDALTSEMGNTMDSARVIVKGSIETQEVNDLKGMPKEWKCAIPWCLPDDFEAMTLSELLKARR